MNMRYLDDLLVLTHLCHNLAHLAEVGAPAKAAPGEEVLDEARADVVAHLLELLVDLGIVLVVLDELDDERAVGQSK